MGLLTKEALVHFYDVFSDWEHAGIKGYKPRLSNSIPDFVIHTPTIQFDEYLDEYRAALLKVTIVSSVKSYDANPHRREA
jgi:hypothetical protein